jgi:hypothetical protein
MMPLHLCEFIDNIKHIIQNGVCRKIDKTLPKKQEGKKKLCSHGNIYTVLWILDYDLRKTGKKVASEMVLLYEITNIN